MCVLSRLRVKLRGLKKRKWVSAEKDQVNSRVHVLIASPFNYRKNTCVYLFTKLQDLVPSSPPGTCGSVNHRVLSTALVAVICFPKKRGSRKLSFTRIFT